MDQLLEAVLAFPTIVYSALVAVSLFYWGLVIVGAADLNPFDGAEGAVKGGVEGAVKGGAEAVKALAGDAGDAASAVKGAGALTDLLGFLGLRQVPITISFSLFSLFGWALAYFTRYALDPALPGALAALAATGTSVVGGLALTSAITKPLAGIFSEKAPAGGESFVGRTAIVTIDVDAKGGQAEIAAENIILAARCAPGLRIKAGEEVVILEVADGVYTVEPLQALVPPGQDAFARAAGAPASHEIQETAEQKKS